MKKTTLEAIIINPKSSPEAIAWAKEMKMRRDSLIAYVDELNRLQALEKVAQ